MAQKRIELDPADISRQLEICRQIQALHAREDRKPLAMVDTYGCQQNEADSERLRGYLDNMGYGFTDDETLADLVVVTSDNPRGEDPMQILSHILSGMDVSRGKIHVEPDRAAAIGWALDQGRAGDVIVLAGKGHETYQEIRGVKYHLDEREEVAAHLKELRNQK